MMRQIVRYAAWGGISYPLLLALTWLSADVLPLGESLAFAVALTIMTLLNFAVGRNFVFSSTYPAKESMPKFIGTTAAMRLSEYGLYLAFIHLAGVPYLVSAAAASALVILAKFFLLRHWVFPQARRI